MVGKFLTAALCAIPFASALTLNPLQNAQAGHEATATWTSSPSDPPVFDLQLREDTFHDTFAIANNVNTSAGQLTFVLAIVQPLSDYVLQAFNISDVLDVYASSSEFAIAAVNATITATTASATGSSTGASGSGTGTSGQASKTGSGTGSAASSTSTSGALANFNYGVVPAAAALLAMAGTALVF